MARKKGGEDTGVFGQEVNKEDKAKYLQEEIRQTFASLSVLMDQAKELEIDLDLDSDWAKLLNLTTAGLPYPMPDGREVMFDLVIIKASDIQSETRIHDANGREEVALTEEAVADITPSIKQSNGNFLPAVGIRGEDGVIELMDGLRRSWACYYTETDFRVIIPRETITEKEAQYIADISLLSKALSYREQGKSLIKVMEKYDFTQVTQLVIHLHGENHTKSEHELIRLKVRAAELPEKLLLRIPDYNALAVQDYKDIRSVFDQVIKADKKIQDYINAIDADLKAKTEQLQEQNVQIETVQKSLIALMGEKVLGFLKLKKKASTAAVTTELKKFEKKGYYARAKETKGKKVLEFGKIQKEPWESIKGFADAVINEDWDKLKEIAEQASKSGSGELQPE